MSDGYKRKIDTKMKDYGDIDDKKKVIRVNPRRGGLVDTVLHEELHRQHKKWNEKKVSKMAKKKEKNMSVSRIVALLKRYK